MDRGLQQPRDVGVGEATLAVPALALDRDEACVPELENFATAQRLRLVLREERSFVEAVAGTQGVAREIPIGS